jgi:hypothetical protein
MLLGFASEKEPLQLKAGTESPSTFASSFDTSTNPASEMGRLATASASLKVDTMKHYGDNRVCCSYQKSQRCFPHALISSTMESAGMYLACAHKSGDAAVTKVCCGSFGRFLVSALSNGIVVSLQLIVSECLPLQGLTPHLRLENTM